MTEQEPKWRKGARCPNSMCVEVAAVAGGVAVRNSTVPEVTVTFSRDEWSVFAGAMRGGEFDDL